MSQLDFLDRYYRKVAWLYDLTRAYYLLGRDEALKEIASHAAQGDRIVEVGAGTGRNLIYLRRFLGSKDAELFAIEPCAPMQRQLLRKTEALGASVQLIPKMGEQWSQSDLGGPADIIFFSYSLSMFSDPAGAIAHARKQLRPGGLIYIIDFGKLERVPEPCRKGFRWWLRTFHVDPWRLWKDIMPLFQASELRSSRGDYFRRAILQKSYF